jgi:hypothetical protein
MIRLNQIKKGDYFIANNEGDEKIGEVVNLDYFNKQVCIDEGVQNFWYDFNQLIAIPISDSVLENLKFAKKINEDGTVKYSKGAFRMLILSPGNFSIIKLWYRDESRLIMDKISIHQLQNHFFEMTKVHLNAEEF